MRRILVASAALAAIHAPGALADQMDDRLDGFFADLHSADEFDAPAIVDRIRVIWSESQSATADLLYERVETALALGEIETAAALADHLTGVAPSYAEGWRLKAMVLMAQEEFDAAIEPLERVIALEPRHFDAYVALGDLFQILDNKRAAFAAYEEALKYNPHHEGAKRKADQLRADAVGRGI
ncbi:MAG: hypothetical protein Tsb0010_07470 [Parvularculaceae bacterium]